MSFVLKTKTLAGKYEYVLSTDPALDQKADGFADAFRIAVETGKTDGLPLKDGQRPTVFELTHLGPDASGWLLDQGATEGNHRMSLHGIALALVGIKGALDEEGKPVQWKRRRNPERGGFVALDDAQLEAVVADENGATNWPLVSELGGRIGKQLFPRKG